MTHAQLVDRAARWLKTTKGCGVVFREHFMYGEIPDALGFRHSWSICVECKTSVADFRADQKKASRRRGYHERPALRCYYLCEPGLITEAMLPEGWGLLYAEARVIRVIREASPVDPVVDDRTLDQVKRELSRLYCDIRRYHVQGMHYEPIRKIQKRRLAERIERYDRRRAERLATAQQVPNASPVLPEER
jgi:hypothetical protein